MDENRERQSANAETKTTGDLKGNEGPRRIAIYTGILLAVFLLGLVPMWLTARERAKELDAAQIVLRVSRLQNRLADAAVDARRGEYEPARQSTSEFFTNLREEIERGQNSAFTAAQQENLRPLLAGRDDTITLLARGDAASGERLAETHAAFRQIVGDNFTGPSTP
ncbi:MAG: hypothetical protein H0W45_00820 [Acidobacteria bacterium]|nr:hypothetical protein [Acidobacteriota bacterium]